MSVHMYVSSRGVARFRRVMVNTANFIEFPKEFTDLVYVHT